MSGIWSGEESSSTLLSNDTDTLFCAAKTLRNITMITDPSTLDVVVRYVELIYYIFLFVFGAPLNIIVLVLLVKYKKLRTVSFFIALQVILVDIGITFITFVTRIITNAANRWLFGDYLCSILGAFNFVTYLLRITLMFTLVIDRFLTVFMPYKYPKYRLKVMCTLSLMVWIIMLFVCIILLPKLFDCYTYLPSTYQCTSSSRCSISCSIILNTLNAVVVLPSIIIPTILYGALFWKARNANRGAAPAANDSSERKATITFFLMFMTLFATIIPHFVWILISVVLRPFNYLPMSVRTIVGAATANLLPIIVILDPIFIMCNRDVREVISEIKIVAYFRHTASK